jgi:hypothetical protein
MMLKIIDEKYMATISNGNFGVGDQNTPSIKRILSRRDIR